MMLFPLFFPNQTEYHIIICNAQVFKIRSIVIHEAKASNLAWLVLGGFASLG